MFFTSSAAQSNAAPKRSAPFIGLTKHTSSLLLLVCMLIATALGLGRLTNYQTPYNSSIQTLGAAW